MHNVLVTGGAGFIGSNFIRYLLEADPHVRVINLDARLTPAALTTWKTCLVTTGTSSRKATSAIVRWLKACSANMRSTPSSICC